MARATASMHSPATMPKPLDPPTNELPPQPRGHALVTVAATVTLAALSYMTYVVAGEFIREDAQITGAMPGIPALDLPHATAPSRGAARTLAAAGPTDGATRP